jgi:ATP-dependent Lon protease
MDGIDVHVHFPEGAVGKDGPSAGVTLVTVLTSLLSDRLVRNDTAMTGEITLSGAVLPVGGVEHKVLAAHRMGIKRIVLPRLNFERDLLEVSDHVKADLEFIPVDVIGDVLLNTLVREPLQAVVSKL